MDIVQEWELGKRYPGVDGEKVKQTKKVVINGENKINW